MDPDRFVYEGPVELHCVEGGFADDTIALSSGSPLSEKLHEVFTDDRSGLSRQQGHRPEIEKLGMLRITVERIPNKDRWWRDRLMRQNDRGNEVDSFTQRWRCPNHGELSDPMNQATTDPHEPGSMYCRACYAPLEEITGSHL